MLHVVSRLRGHLGEYVVTFKSVKSSLPWVLPSVALIMFTVGYLGRVGDGAAVPEPQQIADAAFQSALATSGESEKAKILTAPEDPYQTVAIVPEEVSNAAPEALAASYAPEPDNQQAAEQAVPEPAAPEPDTRQAALGSTEGAAEFFANAQATLAAQTSCKEDLRSLASQTRVYFPAGGLSADNNGLELARLIGVVAESCPGIQIEVQGHSDPSGDPAANQKLSLARAEKVIQRLGAAGIDTSLFRAKGLGDAQPSAIRGPEPAAYYDRRVEFVVMEAEPATRTASLSSTPNWETPTCVAQLQSSVESTKLFYSSRSISVLPKELDIALELAEQAMACPQARLRVVGHHSDAIEDGETIRTGQLRAQALMSMLVSRGVAADQVIIAAPSRSGGVTAKPGLSNSRIDFDVIYEDG